MWAPVDACALPTAEQPLRAAEFDRLFATALYGMERREPGWLRLHLDACAEAMARDLVARESLCCSFFAFRFSGAEGQLVLDVRVPRERVAVLDGLARQAQAARDRASGAPGGDGMTTALRSGQLAKAAGVTVQTLRYYERRGLLPRPRRSPGGHREYGPEAVTVLRVVRGLARLGFTLDEISELIEVGSHRGPRPGLRAAATAKLAEVEARIADLAQVRTTLAEVLTAGCSDLVECTCTPGCPIPFADIDPGLDGAARAGQMRSRSGEMRDSSP